MQRQFEYITTKINNIDGANYSVRRKIDKLIIDEFYNCNTSGFSSLAVKIKQEDNSIFFDGVVEKIEIFDGFTTLSYTNTKSGIVSIIKLYKIELLEVVGFAEE